MDIFRTFDALNDYRNFEIVVPAIKAAGKHFQGCICYTLTEPRLGGEVYNIDYYVKKAKELEAMGADTHLHQGHGRPRSPPTTPTR